MESRNEFMNFRVLAASLGIAAVLGAAVANAQQSQSSTVARLADLQGGVLVSQDDAMVAGANDQRLRVGQRVVTTAGAHVIVRYDNGCDVELKENQRFTVRIGECPALLSEVTSVGPAPVAGVSADTIFGIAGAAGFGYAIYEFFQNKSVSSN